MNEIKASIRCQWCELEQHCHNTDFTCGKNTKGYGHKWMPVAYSVDKDAEIERLKAVLKEATEALEYAEQDFDASEETRIKAEKTILRIRESVK